MKAKVSKRSATTKGRKAGPTKKPAGGVEGVLAAFGAREGTNRAKLLSRLARDIGRPVSVADLMTATYGKDDGDHGKLGMVMKGAFWMIETRKTGYKIVKAGERGAITFTLSAVR